MELLSILLQTQATGSEKNWSMPIFFVLLIVVMYFFMIRPQQKQKKEIEKQRANLKVGDKVVTSGGIHAKLKEINEGIYVIEISDGVKIRIDKNSVFAVPQ